VRLVVERMEGRKGKGRSVGEFYARSGALAGTFHSSQLASLVQRLLRVRSWLVVVGVKRRETNSEVEVYTGRRALASRVSSK
jgi:hypothetical protein